MSDSMSSWTDARGWRIFKRFLLIPVVVVVGFGSILGTDHDDGTPPQLTAETSPRIDCDISKIAVVDALSAVVSDSGDTLTGTITITCDGNGVDGITITSSVVWFASVGPSDTSGVINVAESAHALTRADKGTTKTITLTVHGKDAAGADASKTVTMSVPVT